MILCGATTSGCIRATAVDLLQYGWPTIVPRECVGDRRQAPHEANLFDIQAKYADVVSVDDALGLPRGGAREGGRSRVTPGSPCFRVTASVPKSLPRPARRRRAGPRDRVDGPPLGERLAPDRRDDVRRLGGDSAQPRRLLMGAIGDPSVPNDISLWGSILAHPAAARPVGQRPPRPAPRRCPVPARRAGPGRRRHALRPREHRGRVRRRRRTCSPRAPGRGRDRDERLHARGRRARRPPRIRPRGRAPRAC